ncbi:MAG: Minf_1886 family protein [Phycisphaerales bacterium]
MSNPPGHIDWDALREGAARFPESAFQFVRDGLTHTARAIHGPDGAAPENPGELARPDGARHVSGRDLCLGIRDMAIERYGQLAPTVLRRWGFRRTDDFGTLVYAMIDRGEMRNSDDDTLEDFRSVYEFDEAFSPATARPTG